jgi:prevent-host-death family protein
MIEVGIKQAKTNLSQLFEKAMSGEVVLISRNGKDRVRLIPDTPALTITGFGEWREKLKDLPEDYWTNPEYDAEVARLFVGDEGAE